MQTAEQERELDAQTLRAALDDANLPTLLMVLVHLTGDPGWLREPYRPTRSRGLEDNDSGGLADEIQAQVRDAAYHAILGWVGGEPAALDEPDDGTLVEMLSVCMGEDIEADYADLIRDELTKAYERYGVGDPEPSTPAADAADTAAAAPLEAVVIGAGVSGICAGVHLTEAGVDYTILEKGTTVGGVWRDNHYPGCGVDTPSHIYTFSFAPHDWRHHFAFRDEVYDYLDQVAQDFGIIDRIEFETEVLAARYDADSQTWTVDVRRSDGEVTHLKANLLISAVGAFNKPSTPSITGQDSFPGPAVHTAQWPENGINLEDKQVAVIGNGASAMQVVPAIADDVRSLTVFQRSPQWATPFEKFQKPISAGARRLLAEIPYYYVWYRLRLAWAYNEKVYPSLQKDPEWPHPERSLNAINDAHRRYFTQYIVEELGDRQDLLDAVVPSYPPFGKRMLFDNGWFRTLAREHVELIDSPVTEIRKDRILAADGRETRADVLIYATGFDVVHFLAPMELLGRDGQSLHDEWDGDDARAYLGAAVPGFPNFFCLYGPNTQFGHGGSLITVMERQMEYLVRVINYMREHDVGAIEVRREAYDEYSRQVDDAHERMVWTHPGMDTYYRNSRGRVVVNNPFRITDFWKMTASLNPSDFHCEPRRRDSSSKPEELAGHRR